MSDEILFNRLEFKGDLSPTVTIDSSPLLVRSAGVKTYLHYWFHAMKQANPEAIHGLFGSAGTELDHSGGVWRNPLGLIALQAWNRLPLVAVDGMMRRSDVFHASNLLRRIPQRPALWATVHDFTAWVLPEFHTSTQVAADYAFAERVLRRARGLLAVSEATRADGIRILRLPPEKIHVVYPGVPDNYNSVTDLEISLARTGFSLERPYFIYTGTIEPRKNIDTLLDAWMSLPAAFRLDHDLVLAGMAGWNSDHTLRRLRQLSGEKSGVRYLGYVAENLMPGLTAGALALVYVSRYEGFGIPVAQAMAAGCPVITSNVSSMPEVAGGAALLVAPQSESEIAEAIRRVAGSQSLRERLATSGRERAKAFTWEKAATQSMALFSGAVSAPR